MSAKPDSRSLENGFPVRPTRSTRTRNGRHWSATDFVVTDTQPAYDDSPTVNRYGYCRKCLCDMQSFGHDGQHGPIRHYSSHDTTRRLGLWGKGAK